MHMSTMLILSGLAMPAPFLLAGFSSMTELLSVDFGATQDRVKYGSAIYLACFIAMTALHGMYSDSIARRSVMLWSLGIHTLAAVGAALSPSAELILLVQAVLGLAAGSAAVIGRALLQECATGRAGQQAATYIMAVFGVATATAPVVTDCLAIHFGWRAIFWTVAGFGAGMFVAYYHMRSEAFQTTSRHAQAQTWKAAVQGYVKVLRHPKFLWLVLSFGIAFHGFAFYLESLAEVITDRLGLPQVAFISLLIAVLRGAMIGIAVLLAGSGCPKPASLFKGGYLVIGAGAGLGIAAGQMNKITLLLLIIPLVLYAIGLAMIAISNATISLDFFPERRGIASAMQTIVQTLIFAGATTVAEPLLTSSPVVLAIGLIVTAAAGIACFRKTV